MKHLLVVLLLAGADAPVEEVVARVGDASITSTAFAKRAAQLQGVAATDVLQDLVAEALLAADGEQQGLGSDPRVAGAADAERRRLAAERFLEKELYPSVKLDEGVLRDMFHAQADIVGLRQIVVTSEEEAAGIKARLKAGGKWAEEAKRSVDPTSRAKGGEMGVLGRGTLQAPLAKVAFAAPLNEITGPVKLELGFAVVQVLSRQVADEKAYQEARPKLVTFGEQQMRAQVKEHYLRQLRKEAGVQVDEKFVESTGKRLEATPEEAQHVVATLWGKPLRWGEVLPEVVRLARGQQAGHFSGPAVKRSVVEYVIEQRLLQEHGLKRGHGKTPEIDRAAALARREALARARAEDLRAAAPKPTAADVEAWYAANPKQVEQPGYRSCAHVLLESRGDAEAARKRILAGEAFDKIARELSKDAASAANGGELGRVYDDKLAAAEKDQAEREIVQAIRTVKANQVSAPVKSRAGIHLFRCGEKVAAGPAPLAEVRDAIAAEVTAQRQSSAVQKRVAELRAKARISIDEAVLSRAVARAK